MPKAVEIEDFAAKLSLVCKRLNWSNAKLAQQVGIDKSLAGRWISGSSRPTGNSLMRLNAALGKALPEFTAATWDLPSSDLAASLGLAAGPRSATASRTVPTTTANIFGDIGVVGRFAEEIDHLAPIYCGIYRIWYANPGNDGAILQRWGRIRRDGDGLRFDNTGATAIYSGVCLVVERRLYIVIYSPIFPGLAFVTLDGLRGPRIRRLSGIITLPASTQLAGGVSSTPCVFEFVEPLSEDPAVNDQRWRHFADQPLDLRDDKEIQRLVAPEVLAALRPVVGTRRKNGTADHILTIVPVK